MENVKRIEIVTDARHMREIRRALEAFAVTGYTVVPAVTGQGDRGIQAGDELSGVFENSLLITTCPAERLSALVETIRPFLRAHGGVCLVSDAQWIIH